MGKNLRAQDELNKARSAGKAKSSRGNSTRKSSIVALLLMAFAILIFLALVSYDANDEANADLRITDIYKVFTADPVIRAKADTAHNWLGLVGSMISEFLIKSTIGYSIFSLPFLLMMFGWTILRRHEYRRLFVITNYTLVFALLFAVVFGMIRVITNGAWLGMEWSGVVGDFLSLILAQLLGRTGGSILLFTLLFTAIVMAVDLDLHELADRAKALYLQFMDWLERKRVEHREAAAEKAAIAINKYDEEGESEEELPPPLLKRSPVKIAKPPLEEPAPPLAKQAESVKNASLDDQADPDEIPPISSINEKEIRLEIEKKAQEAEVNFDERKHENTVEEIDYVFPSVELLDAPRASAEDVDDEELRANADLLRETLAQFDVQLENISVTPGPVVTLYELVPATGVKISRIVSLENDIALKLAAKGIRIMAPIPGKSAVGVEIPNHKPSLVTIRSVINSSKFRDTNAKLPLAMGKTISGEVFTDDLTKMPHLLIAGSTGSGKSVGINTILVSLLFRLHPSDLKLVIFDPKKIELTQYARLKKHFLAISPDVNEEIVTNPKNAVLVLKGVEFEMEKRYDRLAAAGVRNIADYNEKFKAGKLKDTETVTHQRIPYLIVVIDELADLMITAAREVEEPIARLAQLARAVGIHLIVATQRPSVDVITGVIKANFPARIAYQVASKTDSRTILDMNGAEQLLGNGDMLYLPSGSPKPIRLQNAFISTDEVESLMNHIAKQQGFSKPHYLPSMVEKRKNTDAGGDGSRDELFGEAARIIVRHQQGSVSLLQRRLKVGYSRAARLVDELEAAGVVGPFDGSKAREVLVESEAELEAIL
ncbi:MAG: DNA translocase FtsK 4TM domain-containing protein [Ignavibacteriae bacterium]|nr:DNA translocase FtsK 4TM domain-containing protein [Ignavibacteriota bacterium]